MYYNKERLLKFMLNHNFSAVIATTRENIIYFTGFQPVIKTLNPYRGHCYAVITRDDINTVHLVIPAGEVDQTFDATSQIGIINTYGIFYREWDHIYPLTAEEKLLHKYSEPNNSHGTPENALIHLLQTLKLSEENIGYDEDGFFYETKNFIDQSLSKIKLIQASSIIRQVRAIKTENEINILTTAARHNENAVREVIKNIFLGINELEIKTIFEQALAVQGSKPGVTMLKIGQHGVFGQTTARKTHCLREGDILWFDSDAVYNGYWSDIARVFAYKTAKAYFLNKYNALLKGQRMVISEIKAGMTGKEVFELGMDTVRTLLPKYKRHHIGHGIGLEPYEKPLLSPNSSDILQEGMILCIEMPYYEFGLGALHIEDPILLTKTGNIRLTLTSDEFEIVE